MTYPETILLIAGNITNYFDKVYHSVEIIVNDKIDKQPCIGVGDEWEALVPSDQSEIIYLRRSGDDEVDGEMKVGSCVKSYSMRTPVRLVYFRDHARNHNQIIGKLMQSVLIQGVKLKAIVTDKFKLMKQESSGNYTFGATSAYFAIDFYALWELLPERCDDFCIELENPMTKIPCEITS